LSFQKNNTRSTHDETQQTKLIFRAGPSFISPTKLVESLFQVMRQSLEDATHISRNRSWGATMMLPCYLKSERQRILV